MPTRRGWFAAVSAAVFLLAGRAFGLEELYVFAVVAPVLVGAAVVYVRAVNVDVRVGRVLHPRRVHAGGSARADLSLRNTGATTTPLLLLRDSFDRGRKWARFYAAPLGPGATTLAAYRLPTDRRGIFDIGPLELSVTDPFALAVRRMPVAGVTQLTVYPRVDVVRPLPRTLGNDPHAGADHPNALSGGGDDFYALRPYVQGDDLRRVHWASTARLDELMIRQDEMPWQTRATILLDTRARVHTADSLELAVSAAASILDACRRQRSLVRLVTTDGTDSGFASGEQHADAILEHLAGASMSRLDRLAHAAAALRRSGNGGALAVVTTAEATKADFETLGSLRANFGQIVVALFERSSFDGSAVAATLPAPTVPAIGTIIRVTAHRPFALAWNEGLQPVRTRAAR